MISTSQLSDFFDFRTVNLLLARALWNCPIPEAMTASSGNRTTEAMTNSLCRLVLLADRDLTDDRALVCAAQGKHVTVPLFINARQHTTAHMYPSTQTNTVKHHTYNHAPNTGLREKVEPAFCNVQRNPSEKVARLPSAKREQVRSRTGFSLESVDWSLQS